MAAHNAAASASNAEIGPGHMLLGLLEEPDSVAVGAITSQGVTVGEAEEAARAALPGAGADVPDVIPYAAEARKAIELAFREAIRLGADDVDTGHLLLALLRSKSAPLAELGVDAKVATAHVSGATGPTTDES